MLINNYAQEEYKSYHVIIQASQGSGQLLLGDVNAATDQNLINSHKIKTIITAASGLEHLQISSQVTHIVFPLMDVKTQNIQSYFQLSYRAIQQNLKKGSVLVHCGAGISRSATLVIAYYMKKYQTIFTSAIKYVKQIRPNICPNIGFELQLKKYQQQLAKNQAKNKVNQQINKTHTITHNKKQQQIKQMIFTFNFPNNKEQIFKTTRITNTPNIKSFIKASSVFNRKSQQTAHKRANVQTHDLFIHGKQTGFGDFKNQSTYKPQKYSFKNPLMCTWGPEQHLKEYKF